MARAGVAVAVRDQPQSMALVGESRARDGGPVSPPCENGGQRPIFGVRASPRTTNRTQNQEWTWLKARIVVSACLGDPFPPRQDSRRHRAGLLLSSRSRPTLSRKRSRDGTVGRPGLGPRERRDRLRRPPRHASRTCVRILACCQGSVSWVCAPPECVRQEGSWRMTPIGMA